MSSLSCIPLVAVPFGRGGESFSTSTSTSPSASVPAPPRTSPFVSAAYGRHGEKSMLFRYRQRWHGSIMEHTFCGLFGARDPSWVIDDGQSLCPLCLFLFCEWQQ